MLMGIGTDRFVNLPIATAKRRCKSVVTWREIFQFLESGSNAENGVYDSPFVHKTSKIRELIKMITFIFISYNGI